MFVVRQISLETMKGIHGARIHRTFRHEKQFLEMAIFSSLALLAGIGLVGWANIRQPKVERSTKYPRSTFETDQASAMKPTTLDLEEVSVKAFLSSSSAFHGHLARIHRH